MLTRATVLAIILAVSYVYAAEARVMFPAKPDFVFDIDDSVDLDALVAANDDIKVSVGERYAGRADVIGRVTCGETVPQVCILGSIIRCYNHCVNTVGCAVWDFHFADANYYCRFFDRRNSIEKEDGWLRWPT